MQMARLKLPHENVDLWARVTSALAVPIDTPQKLERASAQIVGRESLELSFWHHDALDAPSITTFFLTAMPILQALVLRTPTLFPEPISLLLPNVEITVTLTREQVACLIAQSFFGIWKEADWARVDSAQLRSFDLLRLFTVERGAMAEFAKCFLNYLSRVANKLPEGNLILRRVVLGSNPDFAASTLPLPEFFATERVIESFTAPPLNFHADFANMFIGGGTLSGGAVQEEILFAIKSECIVAMLLCAKMEDNEAIIISGAEQFSSYSGYHTSTKFGGNFEDPTPRDEDKGILRNHIIAIDAIRLGALGGGIQFEPDLVLRDTAKCFAGLMKHKEIESVLGGVKNSFVTGNWGCGVFGGDKELKVVQQLIACAVADMDVVYSSFKDPTFARRMETFYALLKAKSVTSGELYKALLGFSKNSERVMSGGVFKYLTKTLSLAPEETSEEKSETESHNEEDSKEGQISKGKGKEKAREKPNIQREPTEGTEATSTGSSESPSFGPPVILENGTWLVALTLLAIAVVVAYRSYN